MMSLSQKLSPARFAGMSGMMAAITAYFIGEKFTEPAIISLITTSDNYILGMNEGDIGYNNFIGSAHALKRNWAKLLDAADLTEDERDEASRLFTLKMPS